MSDFTEEEEDRFIRRNARRMRVDPERLLALLKPQGFVLARTDRGEGANEIDLLRPTPGLDGYFDILRCESNIAGEQVGIEIYQSIIPSGWNLTCVKAVQEHIPATRFGYSGESAPLRSASHARLFEKRVAEAVPSLFSALFERDGEALYAETETARGAADRYLAALRPECDLHATLNRLKASATALDWDRAQHYVRNELLNTFNLCDYRVIWDIAGLCQVIYWERAGAAFRGLGGETNYLKANADDVEAHWRFQIVASRIARETGWPVVDPLVPARADAEERVLWREGKPALVAVLFDEFLAASARRCECGKQLFYVRHSISAGSTSRAECVARCNNGHERIVEIQELLPALPH